MMDWVKEAEGVTWLILYDLSKLRRVVYHLDPSDSPSPLHWSQDKKTNNQSNYQWDPEDSTALNSGAVAQHKLRPSPRLQLRTKDQRLIHHLGKKQWITSLEHWELSRKVMEVQVVLIICWLCCWLIITCKSAWMFTGVNWVSQALILRLWRLLRISSRSIFHMINFSIRWILSKSRTSTPSLQMVKGAPMARKRCWPRLKDLMNTKAWMHWCMKQAMTTWKICKPSKRESAIQAWLKAVKNLHVLLCQLVLISNHRSNPFQSWLRAKAVEAENQQNAKDLLAWTSNQQEAGDLCPSDNCKFSFYLHLIFTF